VTWPFGFASPGSEIDVGLGHTLYTIAVSVGALEPRERDFFRLCETEGEPLEPIHEQHLCTDGAS